MGLVRYLDEKLLRELFVRLNTDEESPLHNKLSAAQSASGKLSRTAFNIAVSRALKVAGAWKPVVRIEITGSKDRRCFTKFGADGQMLETTVASPPRRRPPSDPDAASE